VIIIFIVRLGNGLIIKGDPDAQHTNALLHSTIIEAIKEATVDLSAEVPKYVDAPLCCLRPSI